MSLSLVSVWVQQMRGNKPAPAWPLTLKTRGQEALDTETEGA